VPGRHDLGMKDRDRDLLEPARQVSRLVVVIGHHILLVSDSLDKYTDDQHAEQMSRGLVLAPRSSVPNGR
jgi:hypothetical protein